MNSIYLDELITATELNLQPGRVLDKALEHPVTITRNDQSFALLPRENVALLPPCCIGLRSHLQR